MTIVAGNTVILIIRYILVFIGQIYRIIMLMAKDTFKNSKIICIHMTLSTETPGTSVSSGIDREILTIMIPGGLSPGSGIVASLTESRKSSGGMIRILTGIVVILMTGKAGGGSSSITGRMTINTSQRGMSAGKRELGGRMIKRCRTPGLGGVTNRTIVTEVILHMIWISYTIEITYMAGIAIGRCSGITTGMTIDAG